ncbi:MAG: hypothetical protein M3273_01900 [Actinomycetota bacterium]|nr:hypothetical protein [Actinomycetota bacterium]
MIKKALLAGAVAAALVVPAAPAQATTCAASDPLVDYVLCDVAYTTVMRVAGPVLCKVNLLCY